MQASKFNVLQLGGPYIPLKTGRRDGRRSRADVVETFLPDHNESISSVLDKFGAMGIDTPGVVALLGMHYHNKYLIKLGLCDLSGPCINIFMNVCGVVACRFKF